MLLPGIWLPRATLVVLARRLKSRGYAVRLFRYGTLSEDSGQAAARLAARCRAEPPLAVVGHSLGGLLAVAAALRHGLAARRIVCLGSPLRGSALARAVAAQRLTRPGLGRHRRLLIEGLPGAPPEPPVGVIAGTLPVGIGALFAGLALPHDGVVSVAETELPGLAAHRCLHVNHAGLLIAPSAAHALLEFLEHGRFGDGPPEKRGAPVGRDPSC
ncbi:MAG: alpha/beta hydrolase [Xanthomonadales bacterium]|nr:alpha/beta hydrolase [Xanthomonadales bacterium]